jgi:hypothetical protein
MVRKELLETLNIRESPFAGNVANWVCYSENATSCNVMQRHGYLTPVLIKSLPM